MNKILSIVLAAFLPAAALAALTVANSTVTNVTSTSAWVRISVTATGAANPYVYFYWGVTNGSTNTGSWAHTNALGVCTVATYSAQITGLPGSTIHYYRGYATNGTETNWASYSSQFITLTPTTSAPPASVQSLTVDTNAVLKSHSNFFSANTGLLNAAIGGLYDATGAAAVVQADLSDHKTNVNVHPIAAVSGLATSLTSKAGTGDVYAVSTNLAAHTSDTNNPHSVTPAQIAAAGTGDVYAVSTNLAAHTSDTNNPHAVTPAQIGAAGTGDVSALQGRVDNIEIRSNAWNQAVLDAAGATNHVADTNNPHSVTPAQIGAVPTNTVVVQGVTYSFTNSPQAGDIFEFNPANSTLVFIAKSGAGTDNHPSLTNQNGNTSFLHITQTQNDAIETNTLSLFGGTLIQIAVDGTNLTWNYLGTNLVIGVSAGQAYDGAQGAYVSGQVATVAGWAGTNYLTQTDGTAISNAAAAALPASSTNALTVTAVQITSGTSTTGSLFQATNTLGNGTWKTLSKVVAYNSANQAITNSTAVLLTWTETYDNNNTFAANTWTPGRAGLVRIYAQVALLTGVVDAKRYNLRVLRDGVQIHAKDTPSSGTVSLFPDMNWVDFCPTATNTYQVFIWQDSGSTVTSYTDPTYAPLILEELP